MSIAVMVRVWEQSQHSGAHLLMMLAIADFADDRGRAYPSVSTLAQKCRVKPRAANYTISDLKASGELEIKIGQGPHGTNLYRIVLDRLGADRGGSLPLQPGAPLQCAAPPHSIAPLQQIASLQPGAHTPATECTPPLQPGAPKPSLNRQEPSEEATASVGKADMPNCDYQGIISAYHQALPELPKVKLLQDSRKKALAKAWRWVLTSKTADGERRATNATEALAWFADYFGRTATNDFLTGRTERNGKHAGWKADLDFLLTDRGMRHVIERTEVQQ